MRFGPMLAPVRRLLVALALGGVVATAGCASMGPGAPLSGTLEKIKATKTIALGYRDSSVPFSYAGPTKEPIGYSVDLCTRVVEDLRRELALPDLQPTWVPVMVETRVRALVSGTIDLECGSTTNTLSRQERVDFSLTTFITGASLLALAGSGVGDQLGAIRIAVIPGTTTEQMVKDAIASMGATAADAKLVAVNDHADGLAAVVERRAEVYATDRAILMGLVASASNPRQFVLLDRYLSYEPYALMLRRGDPEFRLAVNRTLARLYRSGQVLDIYHRWFGQWGDPSPLTLGLYAIEGLPE
jgi:ABC-type amino acid transport substrate-binding protein